MGEEKGMILLLCVFLLLVPASPSSSSSCHPHQRYALLRFINSSITPSSDYGFCGNASYPKTASWREDQDCCSWDGVSCDNSTGDVVGLDLACSRLQGHIVSSSPLFSLRHLRSLSLAGNDLLGSIVPSEIGVFAQLTCLNLSSSGISGILPTEISQLSKLVSLDLTDNDGLEMQDHTMRMLIQNLTQMEELNLGYVNMSTVTPISFMNLSSSLISLELFDCSLGGKFPEYIFGLPNLRTIDLSGNDHLTGTLPESKWSPRLDYLSLQGCSFTGAVPYSIGNLSRLTFLELWGNNFTGAIPYSIGNLSRLTFLELWGNNFTGAIPYSIGNLSRLAFLDLSWNNFTGPIPYSIGNLSQLTHLDLSENNFNGLTISGEDANHEFSLPKLQELYMINCNLSKFPSFLSRSKELRILDLSGNKIQEIPTWLGSIGIDTLEELNLFENIIKGSIPPSICQLASLSVIYLVGNKLTGVIPQCLSNFTNLQELDLSNNSLSGTLPPSLANCTSLMSLDVSYNSIRGAPPTSWLSTSSIYGIDLSHNKFQGPLPLPYYAAMFYLVSDNQFSGEISSLICNATSLQLLDLSNNRLTGTLPDCLKNVTTSIAFLNLRANELRGQIPEICHEGSNLNAFDISRNQFEGSLPRSIFLCKGLEALDVGSNKITDSFPNWLGDLPLKVLSSRSNNFHGNVSMSVGTQTFSELRVLDLSNNRFEGNISDEFIGEMPGMVRDYIYDFPDSYMASNNGTSMYFSVKINLKGIETEMVNINVKFAVLDLSSNRFQGEIPKSIGLLKSLKVQNFAHNHFTGTIPLSIGNLTNLELLDLSSNHLTGEIPKEFVKLTFLVFFNLHANEFCSQIPEIFRKGSSLRSLDLSENQFEGPLPRSLSNCKGLEALDVGNNNIVDSFPYWLGDLPLKILSLRSNIFRGHVNFSKGTHNFTKVRILDLSNNNFEGNISDNFMGDLLGMARDDIYDFTDQYMSTSGSSTYYSVTINLKGIEIEMVKINVQFAMLDLSSNGFQGEIPKSIGLLKSLKSLNFSHNRFTGTIPLSVGNLTNLESLDLSSNHVMGEIPKELVKLTFLEFLGLSRNNLTGLIPLGGHFNTFPNNSFEGNPELCGIPLTRSCGQGQKEAQPPPEGKDDGEQEKGRRWLEWRYVALGFGSGMGMGISLGYMVLEMGRPLWLVRMIIRLEAGCWKRSKRNGALRRRNGGK